MIKDEVCEKAWPVAKSKDGCGIKDRHARDGMLPTASPNTQNTNCYMVLPPVRESRGVMAFLIHLSSLPVDESLTLFFLSRSTAACWQMSLYTPFIF
jgi:hypothetical protein